MLLRLNATVMAVMALGWPLAAGAQSSGEHSWQDIELLNGRLVMSAPATAKVDAVVPENVLGAGPTQENLSRLRIPIAGTEIVIEVRELYAMFPRDAPRFFSEVVLGGRLPDEGPQPRFVRLDPRLIAYGIAAGSYRHPSGDHVLANLLVAQPDGTAQHVYVMTWDKPAEVVSEASRTADRMIASLRSGPRQRPASGSSRVLTQVPRANAAPKHLTVNLPERYVLSIQEGPDFIVYNINRLAPLDAPGGGLGIYLGHFPNYFYAQHGYKREELTEVPTNILGQAAVWLERHAPAEGGSPGWIHRETILPLEDSPGGLKLHLFASAPAGTGELDELVRIAEAELRLTSP